MPGTDTIIEAFLCNISDPCYTNATIQITNSDTLWNQFCSDCSEACSTIDFTITTSSLSAPSMTQIFSTKAFVENSGIPLASNWSETWMSDIANNYVAVDIICETTQVESYTESASMGGVDLLSNIGGQTGLWIGISFLSMMEIVEMGYRLIRYHYYMLRKKIRRNKKIIRNNNERF